MKKLPILLLFFLTASLLSAQSGSGSFKMEPGHKLDAFGGPGESFLAGNYQKEVPEGYEVYVFPKAKYKKVKTEEVRVTVHRRIETGRESVVKGKKMRDKFYKELKKQYGTPYELSESDGIYIYYWKEEENPAAEGIIAKTYRWNSEKKLATFTIRSVSN